MTDKQSEALRLADELDKTLDFQTRAWSAAKELRRLHEVNAELVEALRAILDEPKQTMSDAKALKEIVRITKTALAKAQGDNNEKA